MSDEHIIGTLRLLLIAGIDTTWSAIGACLWHLARHPQDRRRLVAEPGLMGAAVEEFLRAYAPVTMAREVVKETEIAGCHFQARAHGAALLPGRQPRSCDVPDADQVIIDRAENRHAAFGLGIHRCIGSNLARMEIRVALDGVARAYSRIPSRPAGAGDLVERHRTRTAQAAAAVGRAGTASSGLPANSLSVSAST